MATALGVIMGVYQLSLSRRQAHSDFEQRFIDRYWQIADVALSEDGVDASQDDLRRYLRLCEDEFELMRLGQIRWATWEIWHDGISKDRRSSHAVEEGLHWVGECITAAPHRGYDCRALFIPDASDPRAVYRVRAGVGRRAYLWGSALRGMVRSAFAEPGPPASKQGQIE